MLGLTHLLLKSLLHAVYLRGPTVNPQYYLRAKNLASGQLQQILATH